MSNLPKSARIIAMFFSDLHLSQKCPIARAGPTDWFEEQMRTMQGIKTEWEACGNPYLYCAGDLFDRWNAPARVINLVFKNLPPFSSIPGQHDLPHHSMDLIGHSAYWTLNLAGKMTHLHSGKPSPVVPHPDVVIHPFGWGVRIPPLIEEFQCDKRYHIAMVHKYLHYGDAKYTGALVQDHYQAQHNLRTYNMVISGDNHKQWDHNNFYNVGPAMRRHKNDFKQIPRVGVLINHKDKYRLVWQPVPGHADDVLEVDDMSSHDNAQIETFVASLQQSFNSSIDFIENVKQFIEKNELSRPVRHALREMLHED